MRIYKIDNRLIIDGDGDVIYTEDSLFPLVDPNVDFPVRVVNFKYRMRDRDDKDLYRQEAIDLDFGE